MERPETTRRATYCRRALQVIGYWYNPNHPVRVSVRVSVRIVFVSGFVFGVRFRLFGVPPGLGPTTHRGRPSPLSPGLKWRHVEEGARQLSLCFALVVTISSSSSCCCFCPSVIPFVQMSQLPLTLTPYLQVPGPGVLFRHHMKKHTRMILKTSQGGGVGACMVDSSASRRD